MQQPREPLANRGQVDIDDLVFNIDNARSRDPIRWTHNQIRREHPTFFQGFFINATRIGATHHVQIYTELRQWRILGYRLRVTHDLGNLLFENAQAAVEQRDADGGREIEYLNMEGTRIAIVTVVWDFPADAFRTSLGAELLVEEIYKIEIFNEEGPNTIIMTLALDYPPIY